LNGESEYTIWCYTNDSVYRWDYCDPLHEQPEVIVPPIVTLEDVPENKGGAAYRGSQTKTVSGRVCQNWASQTPHEHGNRPSKHPKSDLRSNFCRNPDGEKTIWCYTTDPNMRWEYCEGVEAESKEGLWGEKGNEYRGL